MSSVEGGWRDNNDHLPEMLNGATKLLARYSKTRHTIQFAWIAATALPCILLASHPALPGEGVTFIVNSTGDEPDAVAGDGVCEIAPGSAVCPLRAAIQEANAQPTNDTISFDIPRSDPGYDGTSWTIRLLSVLPDLSTNITIDGPGANLLTVTRASFDLFRIFHVTTTTGTVSIAGLTMTNGSAGTENGGAILNEGGGTLNLTDCAVSGNFGLRGGGISNRDTSTLNVTNSTISGNTSSRGGGITNQDAGTVNVTNSTIYGNIGNDGGGIRKSDIGTVNVSGSTITGNTGRGLYNASVSGSFNVKSSIVSLNMAGQALAEVFGTFTSSGFNLISTTNGSTGFVQPTDRTGNDDFPLLANLDPNGLQDNGGPTQTVALLAGSPAIDQGTSEGLTGSLTTDQRGVGFARTFDDPAIPNASGGDGTDIGAFEAQTAFPTPTPTPTPPPTPTPTPSTFANISTRLDVETGDNVLIGGFIITGSQGKAVLIRAIGPSLPFSGTLADPMLQLFDSSARLIVENDNWPDSFDAEDIIGLGFAPKNGNEAAILRRLDPGGYTAIVSGVNNSTGIALIEAYDLDSTVDSKLANISTRGLVQTGANVMIGGIIVQGDASTNALVRALGPSLPLTGTLSDPILDLHNDNGDLIASNDNWKDMQQAEIEATGIPPTNDAESAILRTLTPGLYTAVVRGENDTTGIALVEVYQIDNPGADLR
jgi:CSLREA domain-containing protein